MEGHTHMDYKSLNGIETESSGNETLLGVILDNDLQFEAHTKSLCRKAAQKLSPLSRVNKYLTLQCDQKLLIVNSVVKPQFTCCPLIWMFCSRTLKVACRVQVWKKKKNCQPSHKFDYSFIKNDIMFMSVLCIYKKTIILILFKVDPLNSP